jgi:hypothetical protein
MSTHLSIVNFVLMQNLITELLINMSQRRSGIERNPASLLPFEVYLFVQKGDKKEHRRYKCTPHKSEATEYSW